MPAQLLHFFALILSSGMPQNPRTLWDSLHQLNDEQRIVYETVTAAIDRQLTAAAAAMTVGVATVTAATTETTATTAENEANESKRAELIRQATLIVWDEASMSSRYALEAVDRTLQDITGVQRAFGGKVVLLSGDFRQILPIVPKGTDAQIINECIKKSTLWPLCRSLRLRVNMRVRTAPNAAWANELQDFANLLLRIGDGRHNTFAGSDPSLAKLPLEIVNRHSFNVEVTSVNNLVLDRIPGSEQEYRSVDTLVNPEEHEHLQLPSEYLNSLNISGIPVHRLRLKRFVPVLLLRNLNSDMGLCNGTRLPVVDLK
uniref:ATP-dependent DNA helicase n=1 Tax=Anopheles minimus TaxID=112268 RepID=A0A182W8J3_9DIPT